MIGALSGLTLVMLQLAFLLVMWVLIFSVMAAMRRDLVIGRKIRAASSTTPSAQVPSDAPSRVPPRTLVVTSGSQTGREIALDGGPITLGRAQDSTLVLEDDYTSSRHARLFPQGSRWFIEDLGSTNGTYLANQPLTRALPLEVGVPLRVGKTTIELRS